MLATAAGGVAEVVRDGENGLLVHGGRRRRARRTRSARFFADAELRERLRAAAAPSVAEYAPERVLARLERTLSASRRRP